MGIYSPGYGEYGARLMVPGESTLPGFFMDYHIQGGVEHVSGAPFLF